MYSDKCRTHWRVRFKWVN